MFHSVLTLIISAFLNIPRRIGLLDIIQTCVDDHLLCTIGLITLKKTHFKFLYYAMFFLLIFPENVGTLALKTI